MRVMGNASLDGSASLDEVDEARVLREFKEFREFREDAIIIYLQSTTSP